MKLMEKLLDELRRAVIITFAGGESGISGSPAAAVFFIDDGRETNVPAIELANAINRIDDCAMKKYLCGGFRHMRADL